MFLADTKLTKGVRTHLNHSGQLLLPSEAHNSAEYYEMLLKLVKKPKKCKEMDVVGL